MRSIEGAKAVTQLRRRPFGLIGLGVLFAVSITIGWTVGRSGTTKSDSAHADAFWGAVHVDAIEAPIPATLNDLVRDSDAVVIGRVVDVERGREWVAALNLNPAAADMAGEAVARFATVRVAIESGLAGAKLGPSVALEVFLPTANSLETLRAEMPHGRAMFFLHRKVEPGLDDTYRLVAQSASFFLDVGGRPEAPSDDESALTNDLTTTLSFEELASKVMTIGSAQ